MTTAQFIQQSGHVIFPRPCTLEEVEGLFQYIASEAANICRTVKYDIHTKAEWNPNIIKTKKGTATFLTTTSIDGVVETTNGIVTLKSTRTAPQQFEHVSLAVRPTIKGTTATRQQAYENIGNITLQYFKQYETIGARI